MAAKAIAQPWGSIWEETRTYSEPVDNAAQQRMQRHRALVDQCLNGSDGAWEELVRSHSRLIYGACYRFTGRVDDANDMTQVVFLRVFRSLHTYQPKASAFRTWLVRLTRKLLVDHYRKNKKDQALTPLDDAADKLEQTSGVEARADSLTASREASDLVQKGLQLLSPELREAVILRDIQRLDYREVAEVLDVPDGTVKSRISRGRRKLAQRIRALEVAS
jgi:RNA polymerase sigma-70 factor (ECF subfamily)